MHSGKIIIVERMRGEKGRGGGKRGSGKRKGKGWRRQQL
jgi:hypothetical protein